MNAKVKGYFLGAIAAATYGTNPLFALPLYKDGMDPDSVLFFQVLIRNSHTWHDDKREREKFQSRT